MPSVNTKACSSNEEKPDFTEQGDFWFKSAKLA
jgi:hypothetical protein